MFYEDYVLENNIEKRNKLVVNIPTFKTYEITKQTIEMLMAQKGIKFDITIIGPSGDIESLLKDFPQLNHILLKDNYGSSGAQAIGIYFALKNEYEFICVTDNDALLLEDTGLSRLMQRLTQNETTTAVVPRHTESFPRESPEKNIPSWAFHFLTIKASIFEKIDIHNFYIFLYSDDVSLTSKISSHGNLVMCPNVSYYHYPFHPKSLGNFYSYFYLRGLMILMFREKHIKLSYKLRFLIQLMYKKISLFVNAILLRDFSYIYTMVLAFIGFIFIKKDFTRKIPKNKYTYVETIETSNINFKNAKDKKNTFIFPEGLKLFNNYENKTYYFKWTKTQMPTSAAKGFNLDFVGIGAPKAGTTWLNTCIAEHPEVFVSIKELSFFNDAGGIYDKFHRTYTKGIKWYISRFPKKVESKSPYAYLLKIYPPQKNSRLMGDFTVDYLSRPKAPHRIHDHFPQTKIICVLRQPVERAYSHYVWYKRNFKFEKANTFEEALEKQPLYIEKSLYYKYLKTYFELFGKENILILFYEDIKENPLEVVRQTYKFLNIAENFVPTSLNKKVNKSRVAKYNLVSKVLLIPKFMRDHNLTSVLYPISKTRIYRKAQNIYTRYNTISYDYNVPLTRKNELTQKYFMQDINDLENLLGKDLSIWKK